MQSSSFKLYKYFSIVSNDEMISKIQGNSTISNFVDTNKPYKEQNSEFAKSLFAINTLLGEKNLFLPSSFMLNDPLECLGVIHVDTHLKLKERREENSENFNQKSSREKRTENRAIRKKATRTDNHIIIRAYDVNWRHGIYCFSSNYKDKTMWSYYANNHAGLCVCFDVNIPNKINPEDIKSGQKLYRIREDNDGPNLFFAKVQYKDTPIYVKDDVLNEEKFILCDDSGAACMSERYFANMVLTKSSEWKHECEYRLVANGLSDCLPLRKIKQTGEPQIFTPTDVYFGLRCHNNIRHLFQNTYGKSYRYHEMDFGKGTDLYNLRGKPLGKQKLQKLTKAVVTI